MFKFTVVLVSVPGEPLSIAEEEPQETEGVVLSVHTRVSMGKVDRLTFTSNRS